MAADNTLAAVPEHTISQSMKQPVILSVGGGKGGIGKSTLAANIATMLAKKTGSAGLVDADFGGANLHLFVGAKRPRIGLQDFILGTQTNLASCQVATKIPGMWLISGASDVLAATTPDSLTKQKLIASIQNLIADYILVDLGAGTGSHVADFYGISPYAIVVTDGQTVSLENAYCYLKNGIVCGLQALFIHQPAAVAIISKFGAPLSTGEFATMNDCIVALRRTDAAAADSARSWLLKRRPFVVVNMARHQDDINRTKRFIETVATYLGISAQYIGYLPWSHEVRESGNDGVPLVSGRKASAVMECYSVIVNNLIALTR